METARKAHMHISPSLPLGQFPTLGKGSRSGRPWEHRQRGQRRVGGHVVADVVDAHNLPRGQGGRTAFQLFTERLWATP